MNILDELQLSEADLRESVDRRSGGGQSVKLDPDLVAWVGSLRHLSRDRIAEIIGPSFPQSQVQAALRLAEVRASTAEQAAERDADRELGRLEEGLDAFLDGWTGSGR